MSDISTEPRVQDPGGGGGGSSSGGSSIVRSVAAISSDICSSTNIVSSISPQSSIGDTVLHTALSSVEQSSSPASCGDPMMSGLPSFPHTFDAYSLAVSSAQVPPSVSSSGGVAAVSSTEDGARGADSLSSFTEGLPSRLIERPQLTPLDPNNGAPSGNVPGAYRPWESSDRAAVGDSYGQFYQLSGAVSGNDGSAGGGRSGSPLPSFSTFQTTPYSSVPAPLTARELEIFPNDDRLLIYGGSGDGDGSGVSRGEDSSPVSTTPSAMYTPESRTNGCVGAGIHQGQQPSPACSTDSASTTHPQLILSEPVGGILVAPAVSKGLTTVSTSINNNNNNTGAILDSAGKIRMSVKRPFDSIDMNKTGHPVQSPRHEITSGLTRHSVASSADLLDLKQPMPLTQHLHHQTHHHQQQQQHHNQAGVFQQHHHFQQQPQQQQQQHLSPLHPSQQQQQHQQHLLQQQQQQHQPLLQHHGHDEIAVHTMANGVSAATTAVGLPVEKPTKKKRKRCGECSGCQTKENCGNCAPCKNERSHQICKMRRCDKLVEKKPPRERGKGVANVAVSRQSVVTTSGVSSFTTPSPVNTTSHNSSNSNNVATNTSTIVAASNNNNNNNNNNTAVVNSNNGGLDRSMYHSPSPVNNGWPSSVANVNQQWTQSFTGGASVVGVAQSSPPVVAQLSSHQHQQHQQQQQQFSPLHYAPVAQFYAPPLPPPLGGGLDPGGGGQFTGDNTFIAAATGPTVNGFHVASHSSPAAASPHSPAPSYLVSNGGEKGAHVLIPVSNGELLAAKMAAAAVAASGSCPGVVPSPGNGSGLMVSTTITPLGHSGSHHQLAQSLNYQPGHHLSSPRQNSLSCSDVPTRCPGEGQSLDHQRLGETMTYHQILQNRLKQKILDRQKQSEPNIGEGGSMKFSTDASLLTLTNSTNVSSTTDSDYLRQHLADNKHQCISSFLADHIISSSVSTDSVSTSLVSDDRRGADLADSTTNSDNGHYFLVFRAADFTSVFTVSAALVSAVIKTIIVTIIISVALIVVEVRAAIRTDRCSARRQTTH